MLATNPYEIVKIRMQLQTADGPKKSGIAIIKELGLRYLYIYFFFLPPILRGLYTGLPATLLRDVPFNAIYFSSYAAFKKMLKDEHG